MVSLAGCVSVSLSEEQKARLLQRFKVLCLAGLQTEGNQTDGNNEATLIRCNCCYNLPVNTSAQADPRHQNHWPSPLELQFSTGLRLTLTFPPR